MKQEIKICLPGYKIWYALFYVGMLSLIRGIADVEEIGIALDANLALLAIVFCAETYMMEHSGERWEVFSLFPLRNRSRAVYRRFVIQIAYLCLLSYLGYFLFYWQRPVLRGENSLILLYGSYFLAVTVTVLFWGIFSMTMANLFQNTWMGIGLSLVVWLVINSKTAIKVLGDFSVFAYSLSSNPYTKGDFSWLWGKAVAAVFALFMLAAVPYILKKRG